MKKNIQQYKGVLTNISKLINEAKRLSARSVNSILTATYWEIGRRIVEHEQKGEKRAKYGKELMKNLARDLINKFGKGFGERSLERMRLFYLYYPFELISSTLLTIFKNNSPPSKKSSTLSSKLTIEQIAQCFPLPWSAYVSLLSVKSKYAREFYETETLRNGWSVRQINRQINSQFYERIALSKNKASMLQKGAKPKPEDKMTPEEEIKDPYVLEFLNLKDEYSESDLEEALILHLEKFLMELGGDFAFIGRQKRLRIGDEWFRVDLIFFHRRLKCLVIIDLKTGKFTHADAGQMNVYLNYAEEHWTHPDENPPVGLILCTQKNDALAKYALRQLPNKVLTAEYKTILPKEKLIAKELQKTRKLLEGRKRK